MGCRALFVDGVDIDIYFTDYVGTCAGAGIVVYPCRWTFVFDWGGILPLAEIKVFACDLAFICNRRNGVFFLCGSVWCDIGCIVPFHSERGGPPAVAGYVYIGALRHHYPTAFRGPHPSPAKGNWLTFRFGCNIMHSL